MVVTVSSILDTSSLICERAFVHSAGSWLMLNLLTGYWWCRVFSRSNYIVLHTRVIWTQLLIRNKFYIHFYFHLFYTIVNFGFTRALRNTLNMLRDFLASMILFYFGSVRKFQVIVVNRLKTIEVESVRNWSPSWN